MPIPWDQELDIPAPLRAPLIHSLQRFQMGERGDGAHLKRVANQIGQPGYAAAINLFVEEEQEHAALMAQVLDHLGAPLLERHWSDEGFRFLCRVTNLHQELLVLLVAELIAKRYFRVLRDATSNPVLQAVAAQILRDENGHIAFHCATLRPVLSALPSPLQVGLRAGWRLLFHGVCLPVVYDHRALLRAAGVSTYTFWRDCRALFETALVRIFTPLGDPHRARLNRRGGTPHAEESRL
jgi:hypothetical protein